MQVAATRQDLQGALDYAKNRLLERLATKQEIQTMQRNIQSLIETTRRHDVENRIITEVHSQFLREQASDAQMLQKTGQITEKLNQIDARLARMEQDFRVFHEYMERYYSFTQ